MPVPPGRPLPRARAPREDDGLRAPREEAGGSASAGAEQPAWGVPGGARDEAPVGSRAAGSAHERPLPGRGGPREHGRAPRSRGPRARGATVEETSAGGLVVREADGVAQVALIARVNRAGRLEWCLPKGHLEGEETPVEAAVREIAEETGIVGDPVRPLGTIDYWFTAEGRRIHKTVHHFLLRATGGRLGVEGDPDAEAVEAAWVPAPELERRLAFPNERRIARAAGDLLGDGG
ncbi:NUDIX hydrolase [Pseudokineococcus sp. 5B2Z-1]|uniref:NUDIX hydrolase n=1 Tax=Pseudokineococcus sp. 5B2Z-1 TaxID=3132744 RepID=UPI0030A2C51B